MNEQLAHLWAKPHTSISRVKEFLACPRRYFLKYELRVEPEFRSAALSLGTAWHVAIDEWLLREVSPDVLEAHFRAGLVADLRGSPIPVLFDFEDETEDRFIERAARMLRTFLTCVKKPSRVIGVEVPFSVELVHPESGEVLDLPAIGSLDAVVEETARERIWELKTGAKKWSQDMVDFDLQTTMYRIASRELGFSSASLRLLVATKGNAPTVQLVDVERGAADEDELVDVFFSVHRAIAAGVDHRVRGWQCRLCPYAGACR